MPQTRPSSRRTRDVAPSRHPALHHAVALGLAVVLVVVGVVGLVVAAGMPWTGLDRSRAVVGVTVNPAQGVLHLLLGVVGVAVWRRPGGVRGYGLLLAVVLGVALVYGLLAAGRGWDLLNLDQAGNLLHLVLAVGGAAVAAWPRPREAFVPEPVAGGPAGVEDGPDDAPGAATSPSAAGAPSEHGPGAPSEEPAVVSPDDPVLLPDELVTASPDDDAP